MSVESSPAVEVYNHDQFAFYPTEKRVITPTHTVSLQNPEYAILRILTLCEDDVVSIKDIQEILSLSYGRSFQDKTIETHISNLRKKLGIKDTNTIETVKKYGYRFNTSKLVLAY